VSRQGDRRGFDAPATHDRAPPTLDHHKEEQVTAAKKHAAPQVVNVDEAVALHPWPTSMEERVKFLQDAKHAWREHQQNGGKHSDGNYPPLLVSFDAWKAAGSPDSPSRTRRSSNASGKSGAGRSKLSRVELREHFIKIGNDGGSIKPSMIIRRLRPTGVACSLQTAKDLVDELIKSGELKEPAKPTKPEKATKVEKTTKATKATKASTKLPEKPTTAARKQQEAARKTAAETAARKMGRPVPKDVTPIPKGSSATKRTRATKAAATTRKQTSKRAR
jgi:hypothetical protein